MSDGLPREEARERIFARVAPAIFEKVVDDLKAARALVGAERLALPAHKASVAGADDQVRAAIVEAYRRRRTEAAGCRRRSRRSGESAAGDRREGHRAAAA